MMKLQRILVALLALTILTSPTWGQGRRGGRGGGGGRTVTPSMLLLVEEVQEELELVDDQKEQLREAMESLRGPRRQRGEGNEGERPSREERQKQAEEAQAKLKEKLGEILLDNQLQRLHEIYVQVAGPAALMNEDIAARVGIDESTQTTLQEAQREISRDMRSKMQEMIEGADGDRTQMREKLTELRNKANETLLAKLTEDQRAKFEQLKGDPFEMPEGAMRGGRRGGRGEGGERGERGEQGRRGQRRRGNDDGGDRPNRPGRPE